MSVVGRLILARARAPLGRSWLPFGRHHRGGEDLALSLLVDGWRFGELLKKPPVVEVRIGVWLCAFGAAFLLAKLLGHTGPRIEVVAFATYFGLVFFCAFVSISCGPVVRFDRDGLEVSSRSEGTHFVPWSEVHGYEHLSLPGSTHCSIDLGPHSPLASRHLFITRKRRRGSRG